VKLTESCGQFHFSHLFKQSLGTSPYQYLLQQRIELAKQLLKQTDRSIIEIALMCGFTAIVVWANSFGS
jgi:AraC family transcriptional regulator